MNSENKILKIHLTILFLGSIDIPFQKIKSGLNRRQSNADRELHSII